jgi:hypothetical protein
MRRLRMSELLTRPSSVRCGTCFAPLSSADELHDCQRVPLSTARRSTVVWDYLSEPDEEDLKFATYLSVGGKRLLEPCPFCGSNAGPPTTKVRVDNGMFSTTVSCGRYTKCGASVFYNGDSKTEAHAGAVRLWNDRRPIAERFK